MLTGTQSSSPAALDAILLTETLQRRFVEKLTVLARAHGDTTPLQPVSWLRDDGTHGGGTRFVAVETPVFNRAAINVSHVHYDEDDNKPLRSASALSTIIHPHHPRAPSMHMHISWTEMRNGHGYWRMMADLNPAIADDKDTAQFEKSIKSVVGARAEEGRLQGAKYFHIPALGRHRGVTHFYLEAFYTDDKKADRALANALGERVIDTYLSILNDALTHASTATDDDNAKQLAYHTLYLFQVLTLDRGTTSGLLVHDQNDQGIMGSLPAFVDRALLSSWKTNMPEPQDKLLDAIVKALPKESPAHVDESVRSRLAEVVRAHYRTHPEALELQASGNVIPPTVDNHGPST